jgi:hypothetical protein
MDILVKLDAISNKIHVKYDNNMPENELICIYRDAKIRLKKQDIIHKINYLSKLFCLSFVCDEAKDIVELQYIFEKYRQQCIDTSLENRQLLSMWINCYV